MRRMLGVVPIVFSTIFLSGCAVPVSVTVASWAVDGVSYLATKKSITDHGISFVAGQDCALHRAVTQLNVDAVCKEYEDTPENTIIAIADASEAIEQQIRKDEVDETFHGFDVKGPIVQALRDAESAKNNNEPSIEEIANFETAAGGPDQSDFEVLGEDPAAPKGFSIAGLMQFFKDL